MKIALILLVALESAAVAAPTAEDLHNQAQAAFEKGDYATAVTDWQESYKLSGEAGILLNLAQAYRKNGQCKEALFTYRRFIALDPTAEQRSLADDFIHELTPQCGAPASAPAGASDDGKTKRIAGIATLGAGVVLTTIGLALGHHAATLGDDVTRACASGCDWSVEKDQDDAGRRDATLGRVLDVVGIAAIAGGAALYYFGMQRAEVSVTPVATATRTTGAVLAWRMAW